jgi:acyl-coenzyme A thioesterase PaaI-like protein
VSQQSNFLSSAVAGDLITCRPEVVRKAREVIFMRGDFKTGDRIVFTASAIWRIWPK